jgi:hypothetical protein
VTTTPGGTRLRADLETVTVAGVGFVFDRAAGRLHRLNPTAAAVLAELEGSDDFDQVVATLADRFGAPGADVRTDTIALLEQLRHEGLLADGRTPRDPVAVPRPPGEVRRVEGRARLLESTLAARSWSWSSPRYRAFDFAFRVEADDHEVAAHLAVVLAPLEDVTGSGTDGRTYRIASPRADRMWRVWLDGTRTMSTATMARAVEHVLWHINRMAVLSSPPGTVLHAAAAAAPSGAVLLPAVGNAGKSTVVTGLVRAGLDYLSDEAVQYLPDGRVRPFPKAISLDRGSWPLFPELAPTDDPAGLHALRWQIPPDHVRPGSIGDTAVVRWIVSPAYQPGASARLEPLMPEEAFTILLEQSFHVGTATGALDDLARLVERVPCHRLVSGDVDGAVAAVLDLVDTPP